MTEIGQLRTGKPIDNALKNIRDWLSRIGVNGMSLDLRHDAISKMALTRFEYKGKKYEFRSSKQDNCRLNMHAIARVMEYKVRSHLMKIEDFGTSMQAYLQLEDKSGYVDQNYSGQMVSDERSYTVLGLTPLASNKEIQERFKTLMKTFHPDMALSEGAKQEFQNKASEINRAFTDIKKERGINYE